MTPRTWIKQQGVCLLSQMTTTWLPPPAIHPNSSSKVPSDLMFPNPVTLFSLYLNWTLCGLQWGQWFLLPCKPRLILFHDMCFGTFLSRFTALSPCSGLNHLPLPVLLLEVCPGAWRLTYTSHVGHLLQAYSFINLNRQMVPKFMPRGPSSKFQIPMASGLVYVFTWEFHITSVPPCQKLDPSLPPSPVILFTQHRHHPFAQSRHLQGALSSSLPTLPISIQSACPVTLPSADFSCPFTSLRLHSCYYTSSENQLWTCPVWGTGGHVH